MRAILCMAMVLVAGCTLIDQRTFNPNAGKRPTFAARPPPPAPPGPPALITLGMADPGDYRSAIANAVEAARARKPDVEFDVVQTLPAMAPPAAGIGADAAAVARAIESAGVPARRVHILARREPDPPERTVRVYAR